MVRIILIRHGETTWNTEGRYQGQEETPLSERGIRQGMACAEGLKDIHIDRAISSPLSRSYETCRMAAEKHGLVVEKDERLTEISHGLWEGIHADEIEARYPESFYLWHTHPEKVQMPEGECLEDVRKRVRAAFDEYAEKYDGETVLVAAHRALRNRLSALLHALSDHLDAHPSDYPEYAPEKNVLHRVLIAGGLVLKP